MTEKGKKRNKER